MDKDQILAAISKVVALCDLKMPKYEMLSLRSGLYECGYNEQEANEVIFFAAKRGFKYHVDTIIAVKDPDDQEHYHPTPDGCFWWPDQMKSRLEWVL